MPPKVELAELGNQYGKPDLERLGLFTEMPYMNGKGYVSPHPKTANFKGKNMYPGGRKSKNGTQHGYFDDEFRRIFEGEAIPKRKEKAKGIITTPFMPPGGNKLHSTPGDYYGTFSGNVAAFSAPLKPRPPYKKQLPNFLIGATKMGGCGYADIGLSKYPEHMPDPYMPKPKKQKPTQSKGPFINVHFPQPCFDNNPYKEDDGKFGPTYKRPKEVKRASRGVWVPNGRGKWQGGFHDGCFTKFPEHMPCKYVSKIEFSRKAGGNFLPQSYGKKTIWNFSTVYLNTDIRCNTMNYKTYQPNFIKHLVD